MDASTALSIPAALAGLAYFNARYRISPDWHIVRNLSIAQRSYQKRIEADRTNSFYIIEEHANNPKVADKLFLIYQDKRYTFKQTYTTVLRYAGWLHSVHKVVPGEIIAIDFMNCPQFIFLTLAIWSLGALPAYINYNLTSKPFIHSIKTSTARLLIVDPEIGSKVLTPEAKEAFAASDFRNNTFPLDVAVLTYGLQSSLDYFPPYRAPDSARAGAIGRSPSVLIFTSGTTGLPKAAVVPWERTGWGSLFVARWIGLRPVTDSNPDRYYTAMPLYHSSAFQLGFHLCLISASTLVLSHRFSATKFWDEVASAGATKIQYVGETLRYLLAVPPQPDDRTKHKVRLAFGNGCRPDVWDKFRNRFGVETIAEFYGATEGISASFNLSRNTFSSGAIGQFGLILQTLAHLRQSIVEVDWETESPRRDPKTGFCIKVPRGEPGELLYKIEDPKDIGAKFTGYFNNKEASDSKVLRDVHKKGDAYFRSGDVVKFDKEGLLWFSDRIGDTFRWRSENVSTAEVAQVLGQHPHVLEANVYGVAIPNHEGRAGCAAILLENVTAIDSSVDEIVLESLATYARNSLPKYAVPVFLRVVTSVMAATGNNKQQKHVLRQEGVDPEKVGSEKVFYLRPDAERYEPFNGVEWEVLKAGKVKL
ncbi:long-chain fatty acid transporter fat1 [Exophiala xenobiotica]|uniref:Very long-chain fatty acid transport protein n=1 Tax=Vermiconidia calcicola TaxID=1690605 RepID=A0AAV9QEQ9_9PEZI|nr:long-chain fatty acid transporter fat1 [Exophiala xenobiotica]KAK5537199.1 long-chain fatty acid transporter fat1 [Chaetothyriales sp. CCFEE 6169]KAK5542133.1 long-chain fatty acid transporter fat1 [Vermiconidia calcicola]KAK5195231.1 long-chain fatty acid transporter fat1 [Exophiala xenobiotica]KAK5209811.1 long-chain fatty acid transporter fat1 [Exophiala xenobiotica]